MAPACTTLCRFQLLLIVVLTCHNFYTFEPRQMRYVFLTNKGADNSGIPAGIEFLLTKDPELIPLRVVSME